MPIGQQKFAPVAGVGGIPASLAPGGGFGSSAGAVELEHRVETQAIAGGVATFLGPATNQQLMVERIVVAYGSVPTSTFVGVAVTGPGEVPGLLSFRDGGDLVVLSSGVSVLVFEFVHMLLVPGGQRLLVTAADDGVICTAQYFVMG